MKETSAITDAVIRRLVTHNRKTIQDFIVVLLTTGFDLDDTLSKANDYWLQTVMMEQVLFDLKNTVSYAVVPVTLDDSNLYVIDYQALR